MILDGGLIMREFIEYANIIITDTNADLEELEKHLSMNGYDFGIDKKRDFLFVNMEEINYVEKILEDRNIEYETAVY